MPAQFPGAVKTWAPTDSGFNYPEDLKQIVYARHVTTIYDEVTAIQNELGAGAGGLKSSVNWGTGTFTSPTSNWGSLRERLNNIEHGVYQAATFQVSSAGGSTIQAQNTTTVELTLRASANQTANILEVKNSAGAVVTAFGPDAKITGSIDGGSAA